MLTTDKTVCLIVDVQGNLAHAMHEKEALFDNLKKLIQGMQILGVPMLITEQYPRGLGATLPDIANLAPHANYVSKVAFSCCGEDLFMQALNALGRKQVVMAGIEAHVCVYQTAVDLVEQGYQVEVVADAVSSRTPSNREIGLAKMRDRGAGIASVEMVLYELMKVAGGDQFKEMLKVVK